MSSNRFIVNHYNLVPANADMFLGDLYSHNGQRTLVYHHKEYYRWTGTHWVGVDIDELEQEISTYFERAGYETIEKDPETGNRKTVVKPFLVNNGTLDNLKRAVKNKTVIAYNDNQSNQWINLTDEQKASGAFPVPADLIPMQNGILNTRTRELLPKTPRLFNKYALQFEYEPNPELPMAWLGFLDSTFEGDTERIELVQEMLGYLCTPDLSQQKMFYLIGQPRAGKGTIGRLINKLVGEVNVGASSLSALGGSFGLQSIADKPVVNIGDAASAGRTPDLAMERLLNIVGKDKVPVNPKGQKEYHATLPCRFIISANKVPILPDPNGALRARILLLKFNQCFVGREDRNLDTKIAAELPGIFVWALDGLDRLRERGSFVQPEIGMDDLKVYQEITSPELSFLDDCCGIGPGLEVIKDDLYKVWERWFFDNGYDMPKGGKGAMTQAIIDRHPSIRATKLGRDANGRQPHGYRGVALTEEAKKKFGVGPTEDAMGF